MGSEPGDARHQPTGHRLDPVPAVLASAEWSSLERGIIQRAELLDLIAIDLYGPPESHRPRLAAPAVVFGHPGFVRACDGQALPGGRQLFNYAADLVHGPDDSASTSAGRTLAQRARPGQCWRDFRTW